jgi:hypothetical protein
MVIDENELWDLLEDPNYAGPNKSAAFILNNLYGLDEPWDYDLSLAVIKWLGTYFLPATPLVIPCPVDQDILAILPDLFNNLPAISLLVTLQEGKALLEKTLANVKAAHLTDPALLITQQNWIVELECRLAGLACKD